MLAENGRLMALAETVAAAGGVDDLLPVLRRLCLVDFGELMWSLPDPQYPALSALLPRMASVEVQGHWTGASGARLLQDTVSITMVLERQMREILSKPLRGAQVLDYGCGYGRLARIMYYFTDPDLYYGVDPWDRSIETCREDNILGTLAVSDFLPSSLPVGNARFDLIYAYSVFTHTSQRATRAALETLHGYLRPDGLLAITIRPREHWGTDASTAGETERAMIAEHERSGFAFLPHNRAPIDGDITFGTTSMSLEWLARSFPQWRIRAHDRSPIDWSQTFVLLTPR
jgi:SAM-dependent methyltransferase